MTLKEWTLNIVIFLLTIAMVIIPLFSSVVREYDFAFKKPFYKRITLAGKVMILFGILVVAFSLWKTYIDNSGREGDKNELIQDVTQQFNKALDTFGLKYDPLTGIVKHDTLIINNIITKDISPDNSKESIINPVLDVYSKGSPNPVIKKYYYSDSNVLMIGISSIIPNSVATSIDYQADVLNYKEGVLRRVSDLFNVDNKIKNKQNESSYALHGDKVYYQMIFLSKYNGLFTDTSFVYVKVNYKNTKGESQKPLIRVFKIMPGQAEKQLQTANREESYDVSSFFK